MKFFGHLKTVMTHKWVVFLHCIKAGIVFQGIFHDISKFSPTEFVPGVKFYANGKRSPNEAERETLGYSAAWLHHKGRNKHHFEYWSDYNPKEKRYMPVDMPDRYFKELICDRIAASKIYQGGKYTKEYPLFYFKRGAQNRVIAKDTSDKIEYFLTLLSEKGEKEMFRELRKLPNNRKSVTKFIQIKEKINS